jgi:predicted ArsR family transcriptional regulator
MKQGVQYVLYENRKYRIIYVRCNNNDFFKETKMNATKQTALLKALQNGEQLTAKQITSRFGIANPTATVSDLRIRGGFAVYANKRTNKRGETFTKYRLGTPARAVVAAGYKALAMGLV